MKMLSRAVALACVLACAPALADYADTATSPCRRWIPITPSDTADLAVIPKSIYVGTGGDLAMSGVDDATPTPVTWKNVPTSAMPPARPRRVYATGTTATDLLACY